MELSDDEHKELAAYVTGSNRMLGMWDDKSLGLFVTVESIVAARVAKVLRAKASEWHATQIIGTNTYAVELDDLADEYDEGKP